MITQNDNIQKDSNYRDDQMKQTPVEIFKNTLWPD